MFRHRLDGVGDDTKLRPFFPGMHQPDRMMCGIGDKDGAAVSYVNAEANAALPRNETVVAVETIAFRRVLDNSNACSVYLLRGNERHAGQSIFLPNFPVNGIQPGERFHLVLRHADTGYARDEPMDEIRQPQGWKPFSRKLSHAHLFEVAREERLVSTGVRIPA